MVEFRACNGHDDFIFDFDTPEWYESILSYTEYGIGDIRMKKRRKTLFRSTVEVMIALATTLAVSDGMAAEKHGSPEGAGRPAGKAAHIGHRGAAGLAPENTPASFRKACETGVDGIELDVLLTADGEIVVHHDFRLNPDIARTPDGEWIDGPGPAIRSLSLEELKAYDVGRLKPGTPTFRKWPEQQPVDGERIPTLGEVISMLKAECDPRLTLWIEIKTSPEKPDLTPPPEKVVDAVVTLLRGENFTDRARILSFDWRALARAREIAPDIPRVYLSKPEGFYNNMEDGRTGPSPWMAGLDIDDFGGSTPRAVKASGGRCWAPYYKDITRPLMEEARGLGLEVYTWTVDSPGDMTNLMEMGVDGIITNRPDRLRSLVEERGD